MKAFVGVDIGSYTFNAAAKQITLADLPALALEQILLITNITRAVVLYDFSSGAGCSITGNVLTFTASTSGMADADRLQIIVQLPGLQHPNGEQSTIDSNLANVLGTQMLNDGAGRMNTAVSRYTESPKVFKMLTALNQEVGINCSGYATVLADITGTWAGLLSFEGLYGNGTWYPVLAHYLHILVAPASGINNSYPMRVSVAGFSRLRCRWTAYTSGSISITLHATTAPFVPIDVPPLVQSTTDTVLAATLGTGSAAPPATVYALVRPAVEPVPLAPVAPIQSTTYPNNFLGRQIQYYSRLRVEAAGSQRQPLPQEDNTFKLLVSNPPEISLLEQILLELKALNEMTAMQNTPPPWWTPVQ